MSVTIYPNQTVIDTTNVSRVICTIISSLPNGNGFDIILMTTPDQVGNRVIGCLEFNEAGVDRDVECSIVVSNGQRYAVLDINRYIDVKPPVFYDMFIKLVAFLCMVWMIVCMLYRIGQS